MSIEILVLSPKEVDRKAVRLFFLENPASRDSLISLTALAAANEANRDYAASLLDDGVAGAIEHLSSTCWGELIEGYDTLEGMREAVQNEMRKSPKIDTQEAAIG